MTLALYILIAVLLYPLALWAKHRYLFGKNNPYRKSNPVDFKFNVEANLLLVINCLMWPVGIILLGIIMFAEEVVPFFQGNFVDWLFKVRNPKEEA